MKIKSIVIFTLLSIVFLSCKKEKNAEIENPLAELSPYVNKIYEFKPAPGQFINDGGSTDLSKTELLIGGVGNGVVSLGGFGGYIVFGFDHPITNGSGADLGIYGNPHVGCRYGVFRTRHRMRHAGPEQERLAG